MVALEPGFFRPGLIPGFRGFPDGGVCEESKAVVSPL
jgi:hypothetical protein